MLHVVIINPMVVTCTRPACRLIQVAMCAESSECKNLLHDDCGSMLLVCRGGGGGGREGGGRGGGEGGRGEGGGEGRGGRGGVMIKALAAM